MADEILTGIHAVMAVLGHKPARVRQVYVNEKRQNNRLDTLIEKVDSLGCIKKNSGLVDCGSDSRSSNDRSTVDGPRAPPN